MKKADHLKAVFFSVMLTLSAFAGPKDAHFIWDYPTNELCDDLVFKLYSTDNIAQPMSEWPVKVVVPGTNTSAVVPMTNGWQFFYITASNAWGESAPSNTVTTKVFRVVTNLTVAPK